jgi:hypothetical protein
MQANNNQISKRSQDREAKQFSTNESVAKLKKSIDQLIAFKNQLLNQEVVLKGDREYTGQSWGGAGAIVISDDALTRSQYTHFELVDSILSTRHASAIGDLYSKFKKFTAANYVTKFEMFGLATEAGANAISLNPMISQVDLAIVILEEVISVHKVWLKRATQVY